MTIKKKYEPVITGNDFDDEVSKILATIMNNSAKWEKPRHATSEISPLPNVETFKKEKGVKYCSQCNNGGWDYEAGEGPAEADWFVKGYLHHDSGKKIPYRANLCDAHTGDGNFVDMYDPVYKIMKPITLYAWEQELTHLEKDHPDPRKIEFAKKKITALGGTYYYPQGDWEYYGKRGYSYTSYFPVYGITEDNREYVMHTATMQENASKHTWLDLEYTFPNGYLKEFVTGITKTFKEIVDDVIPSIKRGRITSKEWGDLKKFTLVDPFNVGEIIHHNLADEYGYFKDDEGHWMKVPRIKYEGYKWEVVSRVENPESNSFIQDKIEIHSY